MLLSYFTDRYSPLAFEDKIIPQDQLDILFKAAGLAPSAFNEQPWRFVYTSRSEAEIFHAFIDLLLESNKVWARHASTLICAIAKSNSSHNELPNRHFMHDLGIAVGMMTTQATSMGIGLHQMGGFDSQRAISTIGVPDGYLPVTIIAAGYPGNIHSLPENLIQRAINRKPKKEIASFAWKSKFGG